MKTYRIAAFMLMALSLRAQTAGELLQKGIFDQETAGDLDGAITIYRQIVDSGSSPRDVAAQAQYRLAQALLQKGDLSNGAQEFSNLARNYADYGKLVSSLATQAKGLSLNYQYDFSTEQRAQADRAKADLLALEVQRIAAADLPDRQAQIARAISNLNALGAAQQQATAERDKANRQAQLQALDTQRAEEQQLLLTAEAQQPLPGGGRTFSMPVRLYGGPPITVTGIVRSIAFVAPAGTITVDSSDGSGKRYRFMTGGPIELAGQQFNNDSLRVGDQVTITGFLANDGQTVDGLITARATTITGPDGRRIFDRGAIPK